MLWLWPLSKLNPRAATVGGGLYFQGDLFRAPLPHYRVANTFNENAFSFVGRRPLTRSLHKAKDLVHSSFALVIRASLVSSLTVFFFFGVRTTGTDEAHECAELLKQSQYTFDRAYTSLLTRAHQTLRIVAEHIGQPDLPVVESWKLNERHYGALTGHNKSELAKIYGERQVVN